jgi:hypothetical protein
MSRWPESKRDATGKLALTWRIVDPVLPLDVQIPLTQRAYDVWAQSKGSDFFALRMAQPGEESDIDIGTISPGALVNPAAFAIREGVPGSGLKPYSRCNTGYQWTPGAYSAMRPHEAGHDLGIDFHSPNASDLMYEYQNGVVVPTINDVNMLRAEYDLPPIGGPTVPTIQIDCADSVAAGASFPVTFTVSNTGPDTWTNDVYKLGSQLPQDNSIWGTSRVLLSSNLPPGGVLAFKVNLKAPAGTGNYSFGWRMVKEGDYWFGLVTSKGITLTPADQPVVPAPVPSGPPINALVLDGWTPTGWRKV